MDEVGYVPFEHQAANLFFQLVSSRYERASLIVTSNKPFGRWGEVFGEGSHQRPHRHLHYAAKRGRRRAGRQTTRRTAILQVPWIIHKKVRDSG
ncbi:ATP-binding protein [Sphaerisporangium perillae]|uniref:ATP-binding protein n=1 Tax=Sphaerisporangium perillae TaxID=2935860 RepID=UPI0027DFE5F7|nr:ATP-binding protein [Sphaerisporangium perillae]